LLEAFVSSTSLTGERLPALRFSMKDLKALQGAVPRSKSNRSGRGGKQHA
jgi:hypothetical protein